MNMGAVMILQTVMVCAVTASFFHVGFCSNTDMSALLTLKSKLIITPSNKFSTSLESNWSADSPDVCSWIGISCGALHRRVTALNLSSMQLGGVLPSHLGNLSFLRSVSLRLNNFHGSIPSELFTLRRLEYVNLRGNLFMAPSLREVSFSSNFLSGSIPTTHLISNTSSSSLQFIYLAHNNLTGELPEEIFYHLPRLQILSVSSNMLTGPIPISLCQCRLLQKLGLSLNNFGGSIPPQIGNLTLLTHLLLAYNKFTGTLPQQCWNHLQSLQTLSFANNFLTGPLPPTIFNMSSLVSLELSFNTFSGHIPKSIGFNLPNLKGLYFVSNFLSGTIPTSLFNLSKLERLEISFNQFSGLVPNELGSLRHLKWANFASNNLTLISSSSFFTSLANCTSLETLKLFLNPLNTILPSSIGNLSTTLQYLYLDNCQLKGAIPLEVGNLENLVTLSLHSNRLSGLIPAIVGVLQNIQFFSLSDNILEGPIPHDICKLSRISYIYLDGNTLNGSIPSCLGYLSSLRKLYISNNRLSKKIPSSLWNLRDIQELDLSGNSLSGFVSEEFGKLKTATMISFANNQFTGNIPSTFSGLIYLQNLSLANNNLEGSIPDSFGYLISLQYLDLSSNNLSGVIPKTLEKLSDLKYFNASVNSLEGEIPAGGPFANLSAQSFILNGDLCGSTRFVVPSCKVVATRKIKNPFTTLIRKYVIPIISAVSIVVFGLIFIVLILVRRRKMNDACNITEMVPMATWIRVSYYKLVQAANQFHESNLLGSGAFGSVFKGTLSDGMNIAVKVFNQNMGDAFESFHNECEVMRGIRHRNLVKVITSCSNLDLKCLIMEYMSNGSLEKWLYDTCNLSIVQRLNIMIDVAKALEYLHHGHTVPVIHCDLKPSNVLLDGDMVAHVTDFGISKLLTGGDSITRTLTLATFGYTAPEYGLEGIVSTQGEVYSYGIMLMETFVGKQPIDEMFAAGMSLPQWVKKSLPHNVHEVVDFNLLNIEDQHFEKKKKLHLRDYGSGVGMLFRET